MTYFWYMSPIKNNLRPKNVGHKNGVIIKIGKSQRSKNFFNIRYENVTYLWYMSSILCTTFSILCDQFPISFVTAFSLVWKNTWSKNSGKRRKWNFLGKFLENFRQIESKITKYSICKIWGTANSQNIYFIFDHVETII